MNLRKKKKKKNMNWFIDLPAVKFLNPFWLYIHFFPI